MFSGFICSKCLATSSTKWSCFRWPAAQIMRLPGGKPLSVEIHHSDRDRTFHRVLGAENRLAQGMVLPEVLGENFVDQIVRAILIHLDFFENHAPFAANVTAHRILDSAPGR